MPTQYRALITQFYMRLRPRLHVHDVAAESHPAVRRMFGLHLVRPGEIEPEWSAYLTASLDDRLAADYDVETSFSRRDAPRRVSAEPENFLNESGDTC